MITKNFKAMLAVMLQSNANTATKGMVPAKDRTGATKYLGAQFGSSNFPASDNNDYVYLYNDSSYFGIVLGKGTSPATEDDYTISSRVTSSNGISASTPTKTFGVDESGNPYKKILFTLSNSSASDVTVTEIGFFVPFMCSSSQGSTASSTAYFMIDHTVFDTPVTVPAGGSAAIEYIRKTTMQHNSLIWSGGK